jgi:hypothetical protein
MLDHIHPSKIAETIAMAVHEMERLTDTQVNTYCEKQTLTRMDFTLECDRSMLDKILDYLKPYGVFPRAIANGSTNYVIRVAIDPSK